MGDREAGLDRARRGEQNTQTQGNSGAPNTKYNGPAVGRASGRKGNGGGINRPLKGMK